MKKHRTARTLGDIPGAQLELIRRLAAADKEHKSFVKPPGRPKLLRRLWEWISR